MSVWSGSTASEKATSLGDAADRKTAQLVRAGRGEREKEKEKKSDEM